jgi:hypothetical protein
VYGSKINKCLFKRKRESSENARSEWTELLDVTAGETIMPVGHANIRYFVITKKCEEGKMPIINSCDIGKEKYNLINALIHGRNGIIVKENGQRQMRKGGKK